MNEFITKSPEETLIFAENFAKTLKSPNVVLLVGDLGAGKTTFAKGFAKGLGIDEVITSPTFTILNEYESSPKLYHFDMYRLSSKEEAFELGFWEYFQKNNGIILVEWPQNVSGLITPPFIVVKIDKLTDNSRKIKIGEKLWTFYV